VRGQSLFPAAAMIEAALAGTKILAEKMLKHSGSALRQGSIPVPLVWTPASTAILHVYLTTENNDPRVSVESSSAGAKARPSIHFQASLALFRLADNSDFPCVPVLQNLVKVNNRYREIPPGYPSASLSPAWDASTYVAYPPALDACMHVGALAGHRPSSSGHPPDLRVPSGFSVYTVHSQVTPRANWTWASDLKVLEDGSALSTYSLSSGGPNLSLRDLHARQLRSPQSATSLATPAKSLKNLLYGITWKAADPWPLTVDGVSRDRAANLPIRWYIDGKSAANLDNCRGPHAVQALAGAVSATAAAIALAQGVIHMAQGRLVHVVTRGAGRQALDNGPGVQPMTGLNSAGVAAIVRTAQQESPGNQWSATDLDVAATGVVPTSLLPADGTSAVCHGAVFKPQLRSAVSPFEEALPAQTYFSGAVVIAGGAGGIGGLLCLWAGHSHDVKIFLLGRTARGGELQHALANNSVTFVRCDVASREDTGGVSHVMAVLHAGNPSTSVFQAGGVLRDATLLKLTSQATREVFSPKVGGIMAMFAAMQRIPVHSTSVFSSAGALLGPMGQANYGAANAAANAWAAYQQSQGRR
jgi:KR domain